MVVVGDLPPGEFPTEWRNRSRSNAGCAMRFLLIRRLGYGTKDSVRH